MGFVKIVHFWILSIFPKNSLNLDPFIWRDAFRKIQILDRVGLRPLRSNPNPKLTWSSSFGPHTMNLKRRLKLKNIRKTLYAKLRIIL